MFSGRGRFETIFGNNCYQDGHADVVETPMYTTFEKLSPQRQKLVELCQRIAFGHIENLIIDDGQPRCDLNPRIVSEVKFLSPRTNFTLPGNFSLRLQVSELMEWLDLIGTGTVRRLEIKHGLPFSVEFEGMAAA
jgi:hypothetical protein